MHRAPIVVVTEPIAEAGLEILRSSCELITPWTEGRTFKDEDIQEASAIIVRVVPVTASLISKGTKLKVIGRHGVGLDTVDMNAATSRRIPVVYTPSANSNAVAEHAIALMLAMARPIVAGDRAVRDYGPHRPKLPIGFELRGKVLGVVGLGSIGLRVAEIAHKGFQMEVVGYDPFAKFPPSHSFVKHQAGLRELLQQADVVTLHMPLTSGTRHLINPESLQWMKPSAVIVNTARGGIIDTNALAAALANGQIGGAALDVFEEEPLPPEHPLQKSGRTVFSLHIAGSTRESLDMMATSVARQVLQVLNGERPDFPANPQVFGDASEEGSRTSKD